MLGIVFGHARQVTDLAVFTRHLAGVMASKAPLAEVLRQFASEADTRAMQNALRDVVPRLEAGVPLSEALATAPHVFPDSYRRIIHMGEESDTLPQVVLAMARSLEDAVSMHESFRRAAVYPAIILTLLLLVLSFFSVMILPKVADIMMQLGSDQGSGATRTVELIAIGILTLLLACAIWMFLAGTGLRWQSQSKGRWLLSLPLVGPALRLAETARFTQHLGLMLGSRVPLGEAVGLLADSTSNGYMRDALDEFRRRLEAGESIRVATESVAVLPPSLAVMLASAQERGSLHDTLVEMGAFYRDRSQHALRVLREFFEPLMILLVGIIVTFMIVLMYAPIFAISGMAGRY